MENKICRKCNIEKSIEKFNKNKYNKDGYKNFCISCSNVQRNIWIANNKEKNTATTRRHREKNRKKINEQSKIRGKIYYQRDKERIKKRNNEYKAKKRASINLEKGKNKIYPIIGKICFRCKIDKTLDSFKKDKTKKNGLCTYCRECSNAINKEYYENNKQVFAEKSKIARQKNAKKISDYKKKWKKENKTRLRIHGRKYENNRLATNPLYKLISNTRTIINGSLRRFGYTKKSKTEEILGCSFLEFKIYIESKFEPWMTWENRGKYNGELNYGWDIDHVIPLASAKNEEDVIRLNNYTNLQPLCSYTNRDIKKDTY